MNGREIQKKEYLGRTDLTSFVVPAGTVTIGAYAFAQCTRLRKVAIPRSVETIFANSFAECENLRSVFVYDGERETAMDETDPNKCGEAFLFAVAIRYLTDTILLSPKEVGSGKWLGRWDEAFEAYLSAPDDTGFSPFLAGGEEDYEDPMNDIVYYSRQRRKQKADLTIERLLYDGCFPVSGKMKELCARELAAHEETYEALGSRREHLEETVALFEELGLLTDAVSDRLIRTLPNEALELKSLLIRRNKKDVFDTFVL